MSAEKLDTEIRQEQIAQAALELMITKGVSGLSVAGVAHRVGLVPSAIYRHFRNKDELIEAVVSLIQNKMLGHITAVCEETLDPLKRLEALLTHHLKVIRKKQAIPRLIFSDDFAVHHPERKARVYEIITRYLGSIAEIIRQGQQTGQIRQDIDPGTASIMFLGLMQQTGILWHLSDGGFDVAGYMEGAWRIFRESITA
ncbi:MAG: TetR/AcrR family transcriptional regulator [bacterium]